MKGSAFLSRSDRIAERRNSPNRRNRVDPESDVVAGHGYDNYPILLNRDVPWEAKTKQLAGEDKKAAKRANRAKNSHGKPEH